MFLHLSAMSASSNSTFSKQRLPVFKAEAGELPTYILCKSGEYVLRLWQWNTELTDTSARRNV